MSNKLTQEHNDDKEADKLPQHLNVNNRNHKKNISCNDSCSSSIKPL